jgi:rod shape-determining protein MreC
VTLLTDEEQAIPVQLLRNGVRSVAIGRGKSGTMELRFTAPTADIQIGDIVITSGLDGLYPAGLAVARVTLVERNAHGPFGRVVCQPLAGIERNTQLLILMTSPEIPARPPVEDVKTGRKIAGKMAPIKDPAKEPAAAGAATAPATAPATPAAKPPASPLPKPATPAAATIPAAVPPKEATR